MHAMVARSSLSLIALLTLLAGSAPAQDLATIDATMLAAIKRALPSQKAPYDAFTWEYFQGAGFLSVQPKDPQNGRQVLWIQVLVHRQADEALRKQYEERCAGQPAKRVRDRWVWVLIGRVELRISARATAFESDAALDAFVNAIDLTAIEKL